MSIATTEKATAYTEAKTALAGAGFTVTPAPSDGYAAISKDGKKVAVVHDSKNAYIAYFTPNQAVPVVVETTGGKARKLGRTHTFVDVRNTTFALDTFLATVLLTDPVLAAEHAKKEARKARAAAARAAKRAARETVVEVVEAA